MPYADCLQIIEDRPYIPDYYTCQHKSRDVIRCLSEYEYSARTVIGKVRGYEVPHVWVEIVYEDEIYWYDPTWNWGCWKASLWTDRKVIGFK